jgi:hypothetical protein
MQHDQYPTVIAEQPRLSPGPPQPMRIAPAVPLIRAYGGRIVQEREPGQIVFHHRPEGHLAIHGKRAYS